MPCIEVKWCGYDSKVREWRQGVDQDQGLHVQLDIAIIQSLFDSFHMQLRERLVKLFHLADYMVGKILEDGLEEDRDKLGSRRRHWEWLLPDLMEDLAVGALGSSVGL
jgi:hypothetical protein